MSRITAWLVFCSTAAAVTSSAMRAEIAVDNPRTLPAARTATQLHERLQQPVEVDGFEAHTPLREALGFLSEHFGFTLVIDTQAFRDDLQIDEIEAKPVKLPKIVHVPLRWILTQVVEQQHGAIVQEGAILWIVPPTRVASRLLGQRVALTFKQQSLRNALNEIVDQTGFTIVLDETRAGEAAAIRISAGFHGIRL